MMKLNSSNISSIVVMILVAIVSLQSCKENIIIIEPDDPTNPYDNIDYGGGDLDDDDIDSASFLGLHKFILSPKCAVPACHDGSFEPDYRTVHSAYNTLIYHDPVKNVVSGKTFDYRVVPGSTDSSLLHERITTTDPILGKMPLYDTMMPWEIQKVKDWINNGALDVLGNGPSLANLQPTVFGILAYDTDTNGVSYDSGRRAITDPLVFPTGTLANIWFGLYDPQHSDGNFGLGYLLDYNKVMIHFNPFDFSGVSEMPMTVEAALAPHYGPVPGDPREIYPYYHHITIDTDDYTPGKVYYMRVRVKDVSHSTYTEIPEDGSPTYLYLFFSFVVM